MYLTLLWTKTLHCPVAWSVSQDGKCSYLLFCLLTHINILFDGIMVIRYCICLPFFTRSELLTKILDPEYAVFLCNMCL